MREKGLSRDTIKYIAMFTMLCITLPQCLWNRGHGWQSFF